MNYAYLICFFAVLSACTPTDSGNTFPNTVSDTPAANEDKAYFTRLTSGLSEIALPVKIEISASVDPEWIAVSEAEAAQYLEDELPAESGFEVYATHKLSAGESTGILYFFHLKEQDPEAYDEITDKIVLIFYDNATGQALSSVTLAIQEYGTGMARINSPDEIIYVFSSEMEDIQVTRMVYAIKDADIQAIEEETLRFDSSEEGSEKARLYIESIMD